MIDAIKQGAYQLTGMLTTLLLYVVYLTHGYEVAMVMFAVFFAAAVSMPMFAPTVLLIWATLKESFGHAFGKMDRVSIIHCDQRVTLWHLNRYYSRLDKKERLAQWIGTSKVYLEGWPESFYARKWSTVYTPWVITFENAAKAKEYFPLIQEICKEDIQLNRRDNVKLDFSIVDRLIMVNWYPKDQPEMLSSLDIVEIAKRSRSLYSIYREQEQTSGR